MTSVSSASYRPPSAAMTGSMFMVSRVSEIGSVKDIDSLNAPPRPAFMQVKHTVYQALVRDYLD
jgi:hypothetical protein